MRKASRKSFSPELLQQLREMSVTAALDAMGLYWKRDPDYVPVKDKLNSDNEKGDSVKQAKAMEMAKRFREKAAQDRQQSRVFSR